MSVRYRLTYATACMMFKVSNNIAPYYINRQFKQVSTIYFRCTRISEDGKLYIPKLIQIVVKMPFVIKEVFYGT